MDFTNFSWHLVFLNLGYVLIFVGLAIRDILWLRALLVYAQISLVVYAILSQNPAVAFWNIFFISINVVQIIRILRERRPLKIPNDIKDLYENQFRAMTPREFLYFWKLGHQHDANNEVIIKEDSIQKDISLILAGQVSIIKDLSEVAELSRGTFIGEMSFLSGQAASATAKAKEKVTYISWNQKKLHKLELEKPILLNKFHGILGAELADKIRVASLKISDHDHH